MFGMFQGSGSGFVITSIGIGVKPKNCSGYYTIGLLGVQLELGEETPAFGIGTFPSGNREQLFGIGALGSGHPR
jgi:hypothetical protein